jgi:cytidylate kinase
MAIITISRGTYSGARALAECLGQKLGYRILSREELVQATAKRFDASEEELELALTHKPGFLERYRFSRLDYIHCVRAEMARAVQGDNVVYHGQAGYRLLRGLAHHLCLNVIADMEYRIKATMERTHLARERTIEYIKELDETRDKWVQWVYGVDRNDPAFYDFVINLEHIPLETACNMIAQAVERDFQATPESQRKVDDLVFATGIRAQIAIDRTIVDDVVEVKADDGVITLAGTVRSLDDADRVRTLVKGMPGVKRIESKMAVRW